MSHRKRSKSILSAAALSALSLTLAACGGGDSSSSSSGGSTGAADCSAYEAYGKHEGKTVNVYATIVELEGDRLQESWKDFASCTGIEVKYEGSQEFETQINVRAQGGNPPDLGIFPQPGLMADLAKKGNVKPAAKSVEENVDKFWSADWKKYGQVDGTFYGAPLMASVKNYVWYSPSEFKEKGYEIPKTLDELTALTEKIAADNAGGEKKPWCAGFSSGEASGWPGTDWIEDMILLTDGAEVYDQWVEHQIPFNDPKVKAAFDKAGKILLDEKYVNGGYGDVKSINSTTFQDGGLPILDGQCSLHHQASFYAGQWPKETKVAEDGDVWAFLMPGAAEGTKAARVGGEYVGAFNDKPETQALQTYLSSDLWANNRVKLGGVISANKGLDIENAQTALDKDAAKILQDESTVVRFDGSDLMPGAVGSNSFWKGITDWVNGKPTDEVLTTIEGSWPQQ